MFSVIYYKDLILVFSYINHVVCFCVLRYVMLYAFNVLLYKLYYRFFIFYYINHKYLVSYVKIVFSVLLYKSLQVFFCFYYINHCLCF